MNTGKRMKEEENNNLNFETILSPELIKQEHEK
jgi:hypothetical protein